ncbi:Xanthine/uracil permease family protein [Perilla frutescens var. hirtella]|uniref:Xanthine/uracil permease family protein n=1 Tax=Perilla frutescens var. hirtella TaxID=608512 RepID=A0AAD4IY55_PERFH|nr:Xanthine/uracil permease family protein [Perilla frutescens var. hirtella]
MEGGSRLERGNKDVRSKGEKQGPALDPKIEPFVPRKGYDPNDLRSWAKRTGFVSTFSGETERSESGRRELNERRNNGAAGGGYGDLEKHESISPKIEIDPILGRTRKRGHEIEPVRGGGTGNARERDGVLGFKDGVERGDNEVRRNGVAEPSLATNNALRTEGTSVNESGATTVGNGHVVGENAPAMEPKSSDDVNMYPDGEDLGDGGWHPSPKMIFGLKDNPGYVPIIFYGLQHYLSLAGSLIFVPLITVPAMGGTDKDTATVISTMLLLSGITTILHTYFGTRLPLVQGSSFVYLAPALAIMNSRDFRNLTEHRFRHTMRELQGAIIVGSIFQCVMGFSGLMSLFLRFINPVVVAPTVTALGLAFFSFGFPQAGACVEISIPEILLVLVFTLYLRGISVFGNRVFRIYAVPLSVMIIWVYAFFLTAGGAYNYKGCSADIPSSNILIDACRKHAYTMKHCRTDVSDAMRTAAWVRIPYPLQWGIPIFRLRTSLIMIFVSLVASVDSVGTYHTASMRISAKAPTPGIVSRGIGLEGFCSVLAGLWGSGAGSTTLTENVHTIDITKVASRKVVEVGAVFLIVFSFIGKVGAILASIPQALAAAVLCFMWALVVALGLSTLQYTQTASFRNITIVGVSLFLGLSVPAYFQQYLPESSLILPSYLIPYSAASDGPVHTGSKELDFAINGLLSLNMVVTLLIAFILDNTVPGSRQERGVYIWSHGEDLAADPSALSDYNLPGKVSRCFRWAKCLGVQ